MFNPRLLSLLCLLAMITVAIGTITLATAPAASNPATSKPTTTAATTKPISVTQPAAQGPDFVDVLEAVFRFQFDHSVSGRQRNANYFFLALGELNFGPDRFAQFTRPASVPASMPATPVIAQDPPAELIARFAKEIPPVLPISMAVMTDRGLSHKTKGGSALIFCVATIAWLDADTVNVTGGYWEGIMSSSSATYQAHRENGKWVVKKIGVEWVS